MGLFPFELRNTQEQARRPASVPWGKRERDWIKREGDNLGKKKNQGRERAIQVAGISRRQGRGEKAGATHWPSAVEERGAAARPAGR